MARYPQGVTSFIPTFQAYQPDFTTMGKMLSIRQNQYDQNWKKLNKVYSSLYFSPTTHEESQNVKDQLKNEIDFNLRRISGLDLSLDQNVTAAQQVFQPFYENKNLMYDMAATKNINSAKAKAGSYQNAADPEMQKLFWQDGVKELDYRVQEFKETPYDQIQSTGLASVGYTPYVDVGKMAEEMAKEFGDVSSPPTLSADGKYRITTTNGPANLMTPLSQLYQMRMANDPRIQAMYKTQAYVDRKDYMYQNAANFGGDAQAAERAYLENEYKVLQGAVDKENAKLKKNQEALNNQSQILQQGLENGTAPAEAEEALNTVEANKQIVGSNLQLSDVEKDMVTPGASNGSTSTGETNPFGDINVLRNRVDFLRANSLMKKDFDEAAYIYSQRGYKVEMEADDYALADYKQKIKEASERRLAYEKELVESGTHIRSVTPNGIELVEVKGRNHWQDEGPISGVTAGKTSQREIAETAIQSEWQQASAGVAQGIDIATAIDLENAPGSGDKIKKILKKGDYRNDAGEAVDANGNPLTLASIKTYLNSENPSDFRKQTGLSLAEVYELNDEMLKLMTTDETTTALIDSKFQTQADKDKVTQWKKQGIKNEILLVGINAEKKWLKESTTDLLKKSKQSSGILKNAQFLVDKSNGAVLSEKEYYDNALKAIVANKGRDDWQANYIRQYLADQERYKAAEARLDAESAKNIEEGRWYSAQFWKGVGQGISSGLNLYKDAEDLFSPDNIIGETLIAANIANYDDVKEAWNNQWKKSENFKQAPPSSYGTGTGISATAASATVTPQAGHAKPTQEFYGTTGKVGIYDDYMKVKSLGDAQTTFSGVGTDKIALDQEKNTAEHQRIAKMVWDAHGDQSSFKKGDGFKVIVKPVTGISGTKAAYTIIPDAEYLDSIVPTGGTDEEKALYSQIKSDLLANGASVISDNVNFDSYAYEASTSNPIEADLKGQLMSNPNVDPYRKWNVEPGFSMEFSMNKKTKNYAVNTNYKAFDLETYLSTGKLVNSAVPVNLQNGETLYQQLETFQDSTIPITKAANQERVTLVRELRRRNPGITDKQIREVFATYNFQYNLG